MKQAFLIAAFLYFLGYKSGANNVDTLLFSSFGKVVVYHPTHTPESFVLFISGDGGWNKGVIDMASNIVVQGAMVAGINILPYLKNIKSSNAKCYYPAADLEEISLTIQKKYKFSKYLKPILVGYSSGATLAYGALAQAPANTFKGAISLGFCPDIEIDRPLCKGTGLNSHAIKEGKAYILDPCINLTAPFIAMNGTIDQVCNYSETKKYVENMPMGEVISLPNVGHGFSVARNWLPQFVSAYNKVVNEPEYMEKKSNDNVLLQAQRDSLYKSDLPLAILPTSEKNDLPLAFFISGDGGWTSFDQSVCEKLAEKGIPAVGLDAQKYFWDEKQPLQVSEEITPAIQHYMKLWNKKTFVLLGYSFGACVAPFIASNFTEPVKETLKGVYCFSPDLTGDFEIHLTDMLHLRTKDKYDVVKEMKQIKTMNPVCIFGSDENEETQKPFTANEIRIEILPGTHHYNNDYNTITGVILKDFQHTK
jgi:type IV secretory pathway VirJ component